MLWENHNNGNVLVPFWNTLKQELYNVWYLFAYLDFGIKITPNPNNETDNKCKI